MVEKRKYPRLDTSENDDWRIRVFGLKGRPLEGQIVNLSLGGVAFVGRSKYVAKTVKRFTTRVEIQMPGGASVDADTTLLRVWPLPQDDKCVCVLRLTNIDKANVRTLKSFIPTI